MASKLRLSTSDEIEIAIRWEVVRAEYFRTIGDAKKSDESLRAINELKWRLRTEDSKISSDQSPETDNLTGSITKPSEAVFA
tara:strand:+ start:1697 stop:1942 length:246 start_codon:yes stop_codon:yes gene_type:complete